MRDVSGAPSLWGRRVARRSSASWRSPTRTEAGRSALAWVTLVLAVGLTGCPHPVPPVPPGDASVALSSINHNLEGLEQPLICKGTVSVKFKETDGTVRRFAAQPTTLIFQRPRSLYMDITDTIHGSVARVGSNDERYWMWIDVPDLKKLMWGAWERVDELSRERVTFPPGDLLESLCLQPLEDLGSGKVPAVLRLDGPDYADQRLVYVRVDSDGGALGTREFVLTPHPPWFPMRMIDRGPDGKVAMDARIEDYRPVAGEGSPRTPRHYIVTWPLSESELELRISDAKFRPEVGDAFAFPTTFDGVIDPLDTPAPARNPRTEGAP